MVGRPSKASAQGGTAAVRGAETRQRLLAAAVELVQEVGWGAVSTRAVAQRAGVRPGVVHYHFRSVTDLLVEATVPALRSMVDELVALVEATDDVPAGIEAMLRAAAGYAAGYAAGEPVSRLTAEAFLAATRVPRLRTELAALLVQARGHVAGWLRRHGEPDPEAVATVLVAALDGLILHLAVDEQTDLSGAARVLRALVSAGNTTAGGGGDDGEG